jgi:Fe-S oxidoreductase
MLQTLSIAIYAVVVLGALALFARNVYRRLRVLAAAQSTDRRERIGERILGVVVHVLGQARLLHGDFKAGLMHFFIFWGFVVLLFNSIQFVINGFFTHEVELPLLGRHGLLGVPYLVVRDTFEVLVLLSVVYAAWRRLVTKPRRLTLSTEGLLILGLIGTLMVTDILMAASGYAIPRFDAPYSPLESVLGPTFSGFGTTANLWIFHVAKWLNVAAFFTFLNLLPLSKHFHVLLSPFNVYLRDLGPMAKPVKLDLENSEEFGVSRIQQLHWKNWLDAYNCTECGRCDHFCPANRTGKVLSPQHIITGTREQIYAHTPGLLLALAKSRAAAGRPELSEPGAGQVPSPTPVGQAEGLASGDAVLPEDFPLLVGEVHVDAALWACTTCGACDYHCPVFIEHVNPIMDMRRHLVLEQEGRYPKELNTLFRGLESQANPWGLGMHTRMDWAEGLTVPTLDDNPDAEYLYYVGCFGSFDSRSKPTSVALIELFNASGLNYAVMGVTETCNGDPARRCGHEYLAQMLAEQLIENLKEAKPRKVVTQCPHCFNAFKNDYPDFGFTFDEVIHHSELLARLVAEGKLRPTAEVAKLGGPVNKKKIVFHDSCYLGRYNAVYEEPRATLKSVPGVELVEAKPCRDKGFCCGAGGGRMFMEETEGRRVNEFRYEQLAESGADEVAVACPYCMTMIDDAAKSTGEQALPVRDIALVLRDSLVGVTEGQPTP